MTKIGPSHWLGLALALALPLAACEPKPAKTSQAAASAPPAVKARRCPDPDIRDAADPCSVAYVRRKPGRLTERDLP